MSNVECGTVIPATAKDFEVVRPVIARVPVVAKVSWFESPYVIRGAGDGRLEFDKPFMAENLAFSRNKLIKNGLTTVGEEMAVNLNDLLHLQPGQVVVDLGMGPGLIAKNLSKYLGDSGWIYCLDASPSMLAYAHKTLLGNNATLIHGDIHTADKLIPEKADAAILSGNVHLLSNRRKAFRAIWNTLKPSGKLVIVTHTYFNPNKDTNRFAATIDQLSESRPDLKPEGLRLPLISQKEFRGIIRTAEDIGFTIEQREAETNAPDVDDVFGQGAVPQRTIAKRLMIMMPKVQEEEARGIAQDILTDTYSGTLKQMYLVCTKKEKILLPKQI